MNILLTNDDGINSEGLKKLEKVLKQYGNVYVCAPKFEQSGKACSINVFKGVDIDIIDNYHVAVEGSPVDCVEVGCSYFPFEIDLVVSGCNNGFNLAQDVMYSGTCGACVQASLARKKAIAFSSFNYEYFDMIDKYAKMILDYVFDKNLLSTKYFLNVNFPQNREIKGIKLTKIYDPVYEDYTYSILKGKTVVLRKLISENDKKDSDIIATKNGYISITPLSQNLFKDKYYKTLKKKI